VHQYTHDGKDNYKLEQGETLAKIADKARSRQSRLAHE